VAIRFSQEWAGLDRDEADRALKLIRGLGLPTELPQDIHSESLLSALENDKKIHGNICHFVLISQIGKAVVQPITVGELQRKLEEESTS
jgi:3-dehydroquinate synthetase